MKNVAMVAMIGTLALLLAPSAGASHVAGCTPTQADPSLITQVNVVGNAYYVEERCEGGTYGRDGNDHCLRDDAINDLIGVEAGVGVPHPPLPGEGYIFGNGTWIYQETNGYPRESSLGGSLQRGGSGIFAEFGGLPPLCDPNWTLAEFIENATVGHGFIPCLSYDVDPINDETCGHGPDQIIIAGHHVIY